MNIFFTNSDPIIAANEHNNTHQVKMILEHCQMLSTAHHILDGAAGVTVCEEWHNYRNFHEWWLSNACENPDWEIDKDLKSSSVKVYSPETCILVPSSLNSAMSGYSKPSIVKRSYGYYMEHGRSKDVVKSKSLTYLIEKWGDLMYNRLMEISLRNNFNPDDLHAMISNYVKNRLAEVNSLSHEQLVSSYWDLKSC